MATSADFNLALDTASGACDSQPLATPTKTLPRLAGSGELNSLDCPPSPL
jgi:hypothetical protein